MAILATMRAATATGLPEMLDLAFTVEGERLPHDYAFGLEAALLEALPWLADTESAGVHPIRAPVTDFGLVLSRRARLILRIPAERVAAAQALCGQRLTIGAATLGIGAASARALEPFATLKAWNVASTASDEQDFVNDIELQLEALGIAAKLICGRRVLADDDQRMRGFGLVLHELSPSASLRLQAQGLGGARRLGCGVFVHHKIIEGLDAMPE